jgi:hypothetical protein
MPRCASVCNRYPGMYPKCNFQWVRFPRVEWKRFDTVSDYAVFCKCAWHNVGASLGNQHCFVGDWSASVLISSRMSSARHAVHRADNLTGFGKRPDLTPSHQQVLPRGITQSTCDRRRNPVSGMSYIEKPIFFSQLLIVPRMMLGCLGESHWQTVSAIVAAQQKIHCPSVKTCSGWGLSRYLFSHERAKGGDSRPQDRSEARKHSVAWMVDVPAT